MTDSGWYIQFFGGFKAQRGARVLTHFRTQKTAELLAYLAYHLRRTHPREELIELLWPEVEPVAGRNRLKQTLALLRRELEPPDTPSGSILLADRTHVQLNPDAINTDVLEFEQAIKSLAGVNSPVERVELLTRAVDLYRGDLLPGFYQDWAQAQQQLQMDAYLDALRQLTLALEQAGDLESALQYARRILSIDPTLEEIHQEVMRLYARIGQPSAVMRQYKQLERTLQEHFGAEPSEVSQTLMEKWRSEAEHVAMERGENPVPISISTPDRSAPVLQPDPKAAPAPVMETLPQPKPERSEAGRTGRQSVLASLVPTRHEALRTVLIAGLLLLFTTWHTRNTPDKTGETGLAGLSPAQDRIVNLCSRNGRSNICTVNSDGSDLQYLTGPDSNDYDPEWSPDRTRIVFASNRDGNEEIYVMNADGSDQRRLTHNPARDNNPTWTADSSKIAFISNRDGQNRIYIMDADGSNLTPLTKERAASLRSLGSHAKLPEKVRQQIHAVSNRLADALPAGMSGTGVVIK